jgi:type II secretory pathway pseudopilin PulG
MACRVGAPRRHRGAALLMTMFLVAVIGILLTVAGPVWRTERQRDKEADLLWVGDQYANAIAAYYAASPPPQVLYPQKLSELLLDARQPNVVRHLRRLYRDPLTGSTDWGMIKDASGRITGVYSLANGVPLKQGGFEKAQAKFNDAKSYADWKFIAEPGKAVTAPAAAPAAAAAAARQPVPQALPVVGQ